jgi:hypothetical protein
MQREEQHPNWRDWRLVLLLGLPPGLLEFGAFAINAPHPYSLPSQPAMLFDWLFYFLIAGIIEYQFCLRRWHKGWDPSGAGFLVALVGCACFMLCVTVWMIIVLILYANTPHPPQPHIVDPPDVIAFDRSRAFMALAFLALINVAALGFSAVGARIGRVLAIWRAKQLSA